jgi:mannitol-specific phosphotransferase system IIBC component
MNPRTLFIFKTIGIVCGALVALLTMLSMTWPTVQSLTDIQSAKATITEHKTMRDETSRVHNECVERAEKRHLETLKILDRVLRAIEKER